jgi:ribosomal protein S17E
VKKFENLIKSCYPENDEHVENLRDYISKNVKNLLSSINSGNNKEVERSYRYFVGYN